MLQVKLVRSPIGNTKRNRATVAALGLRKMHQTVVLPDNESIRGMIFKVKHMLAVEEVEGAARKASTPKRARTGGVKAEAPKAKAAPKRADQTDQSDQTEKAAPQAEKPKAEAKPKTQSKAEGQGSKDEGTKEAKPKAASRPKAQRPTPNATTKKAPAKKKEKE